MKVFVSDIYNAQEAEKLRTRSAEALLCNQLKVKAPEGLMVLDANSERIAGTWEAWNSNEPVVKSLLTKAPALRFHKGIDLQPAMLKTVLWANRKFGYLQAWLKKHPEADPIQKLNLFPVKRGKVMLKYLKTFLQNRGMKNSTQNTAMTSGSRVALMVEDMFEWNILLPVAKAIGTEKVCWIIPPKAKFSKEEIQSVMDVWNVWIAPASPALVLPLIPVHRLNGAELFCLNAWMNDLKQISDCLHWGEIMFDSGIQVLVGLAQENTHVGHILSALAKKHGKHMVNTMNGIKSAEAISAGTSFDVWIVWDEAMKSMLHQQVHVPAQQMLVAGSLQQDALANPEYSGSLPVSEADIRERLIISVVSAKDLRIDKVEALDALYAWARAHKECVILYRPHPLETEEYLYLPEHPDFKFELIRPGIASHKQSLKDQLLVSDLVINFGSTVSIEALWMETPCITFEKKAESDLYCIDGKLLRHIANQEDLLLYLNQLKKKPLRKHEDAGRSSIAEEYARIIQDFIHD